MARKETMRALYAHYVCDFRPEPAGGYVVTCPAIPAIVTYGRTLGEARENARKAIELVLEGYGREGRQIPPSDSEPLCRIRQLVPAKLAGQ